MFATCYKVSGNSSAGLTRALASSVTECHILKPAVTKTPLSSLWGGPGLSLEQDGNFVLRVTEPAPSYLFVQLELLIGAGIVPL
jgi:hypothetical protein